MENVILPTTPRNGKAYPRSEGLSKGQTQAIGPTVLGPSGQPLGIE